MRVTALIFIVAFASTAAAEKVKSNQDTKVYAHPGEHGKIVAKIKSGQNMTVVNKEGRWIKVRVQGRTGYVARSTVDLPDNDDLVRNTRRRAFVDGRGTKRGFGGESGPDDRVGADAVGDADDDKGGKADKADKADKDDDDEDDAGGKPGKKPSKPAKADKSAKVEKPAKAKPVKADKADKADKPDKADKADSDEDDDEETVVVDEKAGAKSPAKAGKPSKPAPKDDSDSDSDSSDSVPSGRPTARVTAKTVAYNDRTEDSEASFTAKPEMTLYTGETKGKWTFVENDDGDAGWVLSDQLERKGGGGDEDTGDSGDGEGGGRTRLLSANARLGVAFMTQGLKSAGSTIQGGAGVFNVDNYTLGTSAMVIALGGELLYPYGKRMILGGEASLDYAKTLLGGVHIPATMTTPQANTGLGRTVLNLRLVAGYDLHKKSGMMVFGRLGYRYQGLTVDNYNKPTENPAGLPQEVLQAPTLGAALAMPKLTDKIGLAFSLDAILLGASVTQTKGLADGSTPTAKAYYLGAVFTYRWKKDMDLQGTYNLDYASYDFGKPSMDPMLNMRGHTGTDTTRTDLFHTLVFGVTKGF
jgi:hypothetical protein